MSSALAQGSFYATTNGRDEGRVERGGWVERGDGSCVPLCTMERNNRPLVPLKLKNRIDLGLSDFFHKYYPLISIFVPLKNNKKQTPKVKTWFCFLIFICLKVRLTEQVTNTWQMNIQKERF